MSNKSPTAERKAALKHVCDAENYLPIINGCVDEKQSKKLRTLHMANFMALSAELFLTNYDSIAEAFDRNNGIELVFKARLAQEKDNVEISFKPVDTYKDSASANLPEEDPDQSTFEFVAPKDKKGATVEIPQAPLGLPSPILGLPEPELTEDEREALDAARYAGMEARTDGTPRNANPHPFRSLIRAVWKEGWEARDKELHEEPSPERDTVESTDAIEPDEVV